MTRWGRRVIWVAALLSCAPACTGSDIDAGAESGSAAGAVEGAKDGAGESAGWNNETTRLRGGATLARLPYFRTSGWAAWVRTADGSGKTRKLLALTDQGMHTLDVTTAAAGYASGTAWQHFFGYESMNGENWSAEGIGGAGADPADGTPYSIKVESLTTTSSGQVAGTLEYRGRGFGDMNGMAPIYDPIDPEKRAHYAGLDISYDTFAWDPSTGAPADANFQAGLDDYGGYCVSRHRTLFGHNPTEVDADGDGILSSTTDLGIIVESTAERYNSYGLHLVSGEDALFNYLYVAARKSDARDGAVMRAKRPKYSFMTTTWEWELATGETDCIKKYPVGNNSKNACTYVCDSGPNELPIGGAYRIAVDPKDGAHIIVALRPVVTSGGTTSAADHYDFYESTDAGTNWSRHNMGRIVGQMPTAMFFDPNDVNVLYVLAGRIFKVALTGSGSSAWTDITNPTTDNTKVAEPTLTTYGTTTTPYELCTVAGVCTSYAPTRTPSLTGLAVTSVSSATRLLLTANTFCSSGWGKWGGMYHSGTPASECMIEEGGGVYSFYPATSTTWTKLNTLGSAQFFNATALAVSPVNPATIVAVAVNDPAPYTSEGNYQSSFGIMVSRDSGSTWTLLTDTLLRNVTTVSAHPTDDTKFLVGVAGAGLWELRL